MSSNSIACQVHISNTPHQGDGLNSTNKLKVVELSLEHLRFKNPNTYIALSGHGIKPSQRVLDLCNYVNWEPLKPYRKAAQYDSVFPAVNNCKIKGFKNILKVRADGIYDINDITEYCENILKKESKSLLITQMTSKTDYKMGDCFMYGNSELMNYLWDSNHPQHHWDGLVHIGTNFYNFYKGTNWSQTLKAHCSFRNINTLRWMDLRYNFNKLNSMGWENFKNKLFSNKFDISPYFWGKTNGWCEFSDKNKMIKSIDPNYLEEKTFYEDI